MLAPGFGARHMASETAARSKLRLSLEHAKGDERQALKTYRDAIEAGNKDPEFGTSKQASKARQALHKEHKQAQENTKDAELALETYDRIQARKKQKEMALEKGRSSFSSRLSEREAEMEQSKKTKEKPKRGFRRRGHGFDRER
jgi:hypothetical protein